MKNYKEIARVNLEKYASNSEILAAFQTVSGFFDGYTPEEIQAEKDKGFLEHYSERNASTGKWDVGYWIMWTEIH